MIMSTSEKRKASLEARRAAGSQIGRKRKRDDGLIHDLHAQGWSKYRIAKFTNVSMSTVALSLKGIQ